MTGFTRDELVGAAPPLPYWPPEQQSHIRFVRAATADGGEGEFDMTFTRKNGERFPAIVAIGVSREYDSRIVVIKDVTERQLLTAQLQVAKQDAEAARLAFARSAEVIGEFLYSAEVLRDGSFVMHAQGPGNAELLGNDPVDLLAPTARRLHPDDRQAFAATWSYETLRQADGTIVESRYRLLGYDGIVRWIRDSARVTVRRRSRAAERGCLRRLRAAPGRAAARRGSRPARVALDDRRPDGALQPPPLLRARARLAPRTTTPRWRSRSSTSTTSSASTTSTAIAPATRCCARSRSACDARCAARIVISRWGGEEFCVLLGAIYDDNDMELRAERLRHGRHGGARSRSPRESTVTVTVSVGVARARRGRRTDDLFGDADVALYEAKRAGRNRTRVARIAALAERRGGARSDRLAGCRSPPSCSRLAAAVLHATWNLLLARSADSEGATAVALVVGTSSAHRSRCSSGTCTPRRSPTSSPHRSSSSPTSRS